MFTPFEQDIFRQIFVQWFWSIFLSRSAKVFRLSRAKNRLVFTAENAAQNVFTPTTDAQTRLLLGSFNGTGFLLTNPNLVLYLECDI